MRPSRWRGLSATLAMGLMLLVAMLSASSASAATAGSACKGNLIPGADIAVTARDTTSGNNGSVSAYDQFTVNTTLKHLDGMQAGCMATVKLPGLLGGIPTTTLYLNSDGSSSTKMRPNTVAVMHVSSSTAKRHANTMTFTLTGFASTHTDVTAFGWATATMSTKLRRGKKEPIVVSVNGHTRSITTVKGKTCKYDCPAPPTHIAKYGIANANGTGFVTIDTQVIPKAGTRVTVTDKLTDKTRNERITAFSWYSGYDCVGTWGQFGVWVGKVCNTHKRLPVDQWCPKNAVARDGQSFKCTFRTIVPREFIQVGLSMRFTGKGPWSDQGGDSYPGGRSQTVKAKMKAYKLGGGASGKQGKKITKTFEVDTDTMTTQACATKVFKSMTLPYFQYGALSWTWTTSYGTSCFKGAYQIINVTLPVSAVPAQWVAAINSKITAAGVGHVTSTKPLKGLPAGSTTIAFFVPKNGWLLGRPSTDRAAHVYFASS